MTHEISFHSAIDERFGVPGTHRPALALHWAQAAAHADDSFTHETWQRLADLDAADGFATRPAARGVLRRPSDGRFLIFRYPFRDGSVRFVLPGGGADDGESPQAALKREVLEETGTPANDLAFSGLVLFHLLASTIHGEGRTPTVQYSPIFTGTIADELPNTGGRETHWFTLEEFEAQPRRPISDPLIAILRAGERGESVDPTAVWLPA